MWNLVSVSGLSWVALPSILYSVILYSVLTQLPWQWGCHWCAVFPRLLLQRFLTGFSQWETWWEIKRWERGKEGYLVSLAPVGSMPMPESQLPPSLCSLGVPQHPVSRWDPNFLLCLSVLLAPVQPVPWLNKISNSVFLAKCFLI